MKSYIYRIELEEEDDGSWSAIVPALPGCAAGADTVDQAIEYVREMAQAYVEVLLEEGRPVPLDEVEPVMEGAALAVVA